MLIVYVVMAGQCKYETASQSLTSEPHGTGRPSAQRSTCLGAQLRTQYLCTFHRCISLGWRNKIPLTGWFNWQELIFSAFWGLQAWEQGASKVVRLCSAGALLLACRWSRVLTWPSLDACTRRESLSYKVLIPSQCLALNEPHRP